MSVKKPFFSIIVPAYNRARFLPRAITSVLQQHFADWELLLIDDCSTDNTHEVVAEYNDYRIRYIKNEVNIERSASRNKGVELSKGEYICFLDSDDEYLSEHLKKIYDQIQASKEKVSMFYTCFTRQYPDKEEKVEYISQGEHSNVEYMMQIQVPPSCTCIHKGILTEYGFNPELNVNEDIELFVRILSKYPLVRVNAYTMLMHIHGGNTKFIDDGLWKKQFHVANLIFGNPKVKKYIQPSFEKEYMLSLSRRAINYYLDRDDLAKARNYMWYYVTQAPNDSRSKSYRLLLLYSLPGGGLLRKLVAWLKKK